MKSKGEYNLKKKCLFLLVVAFTLLLTACSDKKSTNQDEKENRTKEVTSVEKFIGKRIDIKEDGSIEIPFDEQVLVASYSKDGHNKLFGIDGAILVIEGDEIVYSEEHKSIVHLETDRLTVSEDGRFAAWRSHMEDFEISIYDFENHSAHLIEETDEYDPYMVFEPLLIEKHDDTYYLLSNKHLVGSSPELVINLNEMEMTDDETILKKLTPKEPIEDDDTYHEVRAEASTLGLEDGFYSEYGYYNFYYAAEEYDEDDIEMTLTQLYGNDASKGTLSEIELEGRAFDKDNITIFRFSHLQLDTLTIQVSDNGMLILPIVDGDLEGNDYHLSVYVADLTKDQPVAQLVAEEKVTEERPTILFNEDASAIYISKNAILEKYEI